MTHNYTVLRIMDEWYMYMYIQTIKVDKYVWSFKNNQTAFGWRFVFNDSLLSSVT
jgi:hypothetical protein